MTYTPEELRALADILDGIPTDEPRRRAAAILREMAEQKPVAWMWQHPAGLLRPRCRCASRA
jgi:hypothetical protein